MIRHNGDTTLATAAVPPHDLASIVKPPAWHASALCAQTDPESWFPEKGQGDRAKAARAVCNGNPARNVPPCPVREECLAYALEHDERFGIFGGVTERERRRMIRERKAS